MKNWSAIVNENGPAVLRIAFRILGNHTDAEDVAQDVFCEAWRIHSKRSFPDWPGMLRRMAVLRAIDVLRRKRPANLVNINAVEEVKSDPVDLVIHREQASRLREALGHLSGQQAAVFTLFYFEDLDREEIAKTLQTSVGAVSTSLSKARRELRRQFKDINSEAEP